MSIFCPFCLVEHELEGDKRNECKKGDKINTLPQTYIKAVQRGAAVYPIAVIGYTGCGKTTYLSSFIYALYHKLPREWFSILVLNQQTIDKIEKDYIPFLRRGNFPPQTARFFEEPLILKLTIPEKKLNVIKSKREVILVIYDTKGGNYDSVDTIKDNFPLIKLIPNLVLLADLYSMCTETIEISADMKLHSLANKLTLALDELDAPMKKKNLIVCFTKTDKFWDMKGAKEDFGPLSHSPLEPKSDLKSYGKEEIYKASEAIQVFIKEKYNNFFEVIDEHYGGYCFVASSNIGCCQVNDTGSTFCGEYSPLGVVDPLLWLLNI